VLLYFLKWVESENGGNGGKSWVNDHVDSIYSIGAPYLGCPKSFSSIFSGEMRDLAEMNEYVAYWYRKGSLMFTQTDIVLLFRTLFSVPSMLPKGGDAIWGNQEGSGDDIRCQYFSDEQPTADNTTRCPNIDTDRFLWWQKPVAKYTSAFGTRRGSFLTFTSQHLEKHENHSIPVEMTYEQALRLLHETAPEFMNFTSTLYSFTSTTDPSTTANDQRYWSNPLEFELPNAPNLTIYCGYGVGRDTERGYVYQHQFHEISPNNTLTPHFRINSSHTDESVSIRKGIKLTDGDGTVPLVSLGYMCANGWRKQKKYNPHGVKVVIREFIEKNSTQTPIPLMRSSTSSEHVDLIVSRAFFFSGNATV